MSEKHAEIPAAEVFARRLKAVRKAAGNVSQAELSRRLAEIGYNLSRSQIADLESEDPERRRRVTVDDLLAIAAALGVAPLHLIVPFEEEEPMMVEPRLDEYDVPVFLAPVRLRVGALTMLPSEARRWITGRQINLDADVSLWERYYTEEVPPARRWRVREWKRVLAGERQAPADVNDPLNRPTEDVEPEMASDVVDAQGRVRRRSLPTWLWVALRGQDPYGKED
jgi:transcriptional regulator with XRE-family HTH domain